MRTIVAFLFGAALAAQAQQRPDPEEQIKRQENRVAQNPDRVAERVTLLRLYFGNGHSLPPEKVREERRRHITWLIEHHPDANEFAQPEFVIEAKGSPLADPEGFAEAARLWREQAAKPDASAKTIANAVYFFKTADRATAAAILDPAWRAHPDSADLAPARAILDVIAILGITSISGREVTGSDFVLRSSPEATKARQEIEGSSNPALLGSAGQQLFQWSNAIRPGPFSPFGPARDYFAEQEEMASLAERWLRRARELDPSKPAWTVALIQVLQSRAGRTQDPREKVTILRDADSLANDSQRANVLPALAMAEFEAGDDDAAAHDGQRLLELTSSSQGFARGNMLHIGNTVLGRVALARKDTKTARERLLASARVEGQLPNANMTLAQDLLEAGEREVVLEYLNLCRGFWIYDQGQLDRKIKLVKAPGTPDLTARTLPAGLALNGKPAPAFKLKDLSGKDWSLDRLTNKIIALEFFTTSCESCRDELGTLQKLSADRDVVALAVNVSEAEPDVRGFVEENHLRLPVLLGASDAMIRHYEVETYPTLVMIDRKTIISLYRPGRASDLKRDLEQGIAGPPERPVLPAPKLLASTSGKLTWEPVEGAQSYVVEWDCKEAGGWTFDRSGTLRVIPTRATSVTFEEGGGRPLRWRVYAVGSPGGAGKPTSWREIP